MKVGAEAFSSEEIADLCSRGHATGRHSVDVDGGIPVDQHEGKTRCMQAAVCSVRMRAHPNSLFADLIFVSNVPNLITHAQAGTQRGNPEDPSAPPRLP
jgi:hypothetical protein